VWPVEVSELHKNAEIGEKGAQAGSP
jgi:hypothetical protein